MTPGFWRLARRERGAYPRICNERATPPAAKRTSQVATLIYYRLLNGRRYRRFSSTDPSASWPRNGHISHTSHISHLFPCCISHDAMYNSCNCSGGRVGQTSGLPIGRASGPVFRPHPGHRAGGPVNWQAGGPPHTRTVTNSSNNTAHITFSVTVQVAGRFQTPTASLIPAQGNALGLPVKDHSER